MPPNLPACITRHSLTPVTGFGLRPCALPPPVSLPTQLPIVFAPRVPGPSEGMLLITGDTNVPVSVSLHGRTA